MLKPSTQDNDPRAAFLRHADAAAKDPKFIDNAYAETQACCPPHRTPQGTCWPLSGQTLSGHDPVGERSPR